MKINGMKRLMESGVRLRKVAGDRWRYGRFLEIDRHGPNKFVVGLTTSHKVHPGNVAVFEPVLGMAYSSLPDVKRAIAKALQDNKKRTADLARELGFDI